jgi:hypothetical protein
VVISNCVSNVSTNTAAVAPKIRAVLRPAGRLAVSDVRTSERAYRQMHTCRMRKYLSAAQVMELAELLEDAPNRVGVVDEVLQAAAEGRGMTLRLSEPEPERENP